MPNKGQDMNASELKAKVESAGHEPYFFSRKTMKAFGDSMRNYGVRSAVIVSEYDSAGNYVGAVSIEVWELYRKRPVNGGSSGPAYFSKEHFNQVFPKRE